MYCEVIQRSESFLFSKGKCSMIIEGLSMEEFFSVILFFSGFSCNIHTSLFDFYKLTLSDEFLETQTS